MESNTATSILIQSWLSLQLNEARLYTFPPESAKVCVTDGEVCVKRSKFVDPVSRVLAHITGNEICEGIGHKRWYGIVGKIITYLEEHPECHLAKCQGVGSPSQP